MIENKLICRELSKDYGKKQVLKGLNLEIEKGKIYGLIGRNGAGKTTLLSIMSGQNAATAGNVTVDGEPVWENLDALEKICFSREINILGGGNALKARDYLRAAKIYLPNWDQEMADKLIRDFKLDIKKKVNQLSKGMLSMLTIIIAMASKSEYTFLDEPVAGLDVVAREKFYKLLLEEYEKTERTFVISTHIIEEAADVFEEVIILDQGEISIKENTQDLLERVVHISGKEDEINAFLEGKNVLSTEKLGRSKGATIMYESPEALAHEKFGEITAQPLNLQHIFVAMCGKEDEA